MYQSDFSIEELRARRREVCKQIGDATALIVGARACSGTVPFRQYNDFYYLCGVEVPQSYLLIDGSAGEATLFLPERRHLVIDHDDPVVCADEPDYTLEASGIERVCKREQLGDYLKDVGTLYTFMRDGEGPQSCVRSLRDARTAIDADPWDGQPDRGAWFCEQLKSKYSGLEIKDLAPIIYEMRMIKSHKEIELLRRAGQLAALGLCEAMRATKPGVMEYQLAAAMQYQYLAGGSMDYSYAPIVGGGKNAFYGHYHINTSPLLDGDMVLFDCAPDYRYYCSDITRMWPVNGAFTPAQRALYGFATEYHKTLLSLIRPGRTCADIDDEAANIMESRLDEFDFATESHATGPRWSFNFRKQLAHSVGLSVHDGLSHHDAPLKPGQVFAVDPQVRIEADRLYLRVEDTGVVTEDGFEVFTKDAPYELDDIEAMMRGESILDRFPPLP